MRQVFIGAVAAAVVTVSVGFYAQPARAASQGAGSAPIRLAQNGNSNMFGLLQDIQRLREQVRRLRGEVESLKYQIQRNQDNRQRMYQQLDGRLTALEGGGAVAGSGGGAPVDKAGAGKAYQAAFGSLRDGKYNAAISGFEAFVKKYPNSEQTDEALYWLGQARYVQGDLSGASSALQQMIKQFPQSAKVPSALLRIGVIQQTVGKAKQAKATFQRIIDNYPDSESASKARQHL